MVDNEKIDKVFDVLDATMVKALNEHNPSFEEIHVVFWRLRQKVREQEWSVYQQFLHDEGLPPKGTEGMYR